MRRRPDASPSRRSLAGLRVLVAEDEFLIALSIEDALARAGCEVVGPVARADQARQIASRTRLDGAILDVDLAGETAEPVARQLLHEGVPVVFATAARADELSPLLRGMPRLEKPYELDSLIAVAAEAFTRSRASQA
jgi:DNA-binding response OmpR family regulator